jgi:RNA polymerase sigma-70 factor (ECF subfamily)
VFSSTLAKTQNKNRGTARMSEQELDWQIVQRVQQGEQAAFNLLVRKYQHRVANLISRYVSCQGDVPDVMQDAFIKAYRALPGFRGDSAFYTWLYRIAVNSAKNYLTASGRKPPSADIDVDDADSYDGSDALKVQESPEQLLLTEEIRLVVFNTIEQLPEDLRVAITLRELDGMSYEEIAEVMGCPIGTVRSRIFRAREAIDAKLKPLIS